MHNRHIPVDHKWTFPYCFYAIDLDELSDLDQYVFGFGYNHWRPVSVRDEDYLQGSGSFRERLSEFVDTSTVEQIILITVARFMKKGFNPVSFYYCLDKEGLPVYMVAEVNNTFSERHLYILDGGKSYPLYCKQSKEFHVSPFNNMEGEYEFSFSAPDDELHIGIQLVRDGRVVMEAALWGEGIAFTAKNLWKTVLRFPFNAAATMPRILIQAAILHYKKKLPVFKKPEPSHEMTFSVK